MSRTLSLTFSILLAAVMVGVIFGILTDSRNSILVKEMVYVAGGALASLIGGILVLRGTVCFSRRLRGNFLLFLTAVILYSVVRHLTGFGSVNGPFTILMLLSLSALTVTGVLFVNRDGFRLLTTVLLSCSGILFVYAIMQWQGMNVFQWDAALTRSGRSTGSLGNPNLLGGFASALVPLGFTVLITWKRFSKGLRYAFASLFTVLAVVAVIASGTRGSLLGVAAGCIFMAVWYIRKYGVRLKAAVPVLLLLAAILTATSLPMSSRLSELDPDAEEQGTLQVRKLIWSGALSVFADNPVFGHGPGSFQILYPEHRNPDYSLLGVSHNTLHAHCEYLEILVDLGIVGLILWGAVVFFAVKSLRNADPLRAAAFAGIVAMLAEALVSVHLRWPPTAWLFAFFATLFLAGEVEPRGIEHKRRIFLGSGLILASAALSWGFFYHYLPAMESSRLVFMGKDVYLNRTESAMQNAYSAALQWQNTADERALNAALNSWSYAENCADSSVYYSRLGTEVYPNDLGSWYALGSAHLTRYMVMRPPVTAMQEAIDYAGYGYPCTDQQLAEELDLGMEAYYRLVSMAPNYAEVHNNLALGFSNMGQVDQALEELNLAYELHGHRRGDYHQQAISLLPLSEGSFAGCTLVFHHLVTMFDPEVQGERRRAKLADIASFVSLIYGTLPEQRDSLAEVFQEIAVNELGPEQASDLIEVVRTETPRDIYDWWTAEDTTVGTLEELSGIYLPTLARFPFAGNCFPGQLPGERSFYTIPADVFANEGFSALSFDGAMEALLYQIEVDRNLDAAYTLALSSRFSGSVSQKTVDDLNRVREAVGGSRTALRSGIEAPWLEGSLPGRLSDTLQSLQQQDSLESAWYEMELEMTFLVLSSYWWDYQIFSWSQNQYLLERAFLCRDRIRDLNPSSWQSRVSTILERTSQRAALFTSHQRQPQLDQLESDLAGGLERAAPPPE